MATASSVWKTWCEFHVAWFGEGVRTVPLDASKIRKIAASFKQGGYKGFAAYASKAKEHHILAGFQWDSLGPVRRLGTFFGTLCAGFLPLKPPRPRGVSASCSQAIKYEYVCKKLAFWIFEIFLHFRVLGSPFWRKIAPEILKDSLLYGAPSGGRSGTKIDGSRPSEGAQRRTGDPEHQKPPRNSISGHVSQCGVGGENREISPDFARLATFSKSKYQQPMTPL